MPVADLSETSHFGLRLMRDLADHAGGRLEVDSSAPGHGNLGQARGAAAVIRLLIADDHPLVRTALAQLLGAAEDISVVAVTGDGREAVQEALGPHPTSC